MNIFTSLIAKIREVLRRVIPYRTIEQAEHVDTPLSTEMTNALDTWYHMYIDKADWLKEEQVKSLNLAAFISSEISRQVTLELKCSITGKTEAGSDETVTNPRAEYLNDEFQKVLDILRLKLEQGCAAGGMIIKPYPNTDDGHIYFDYTMDWSMYPLAFDDDGNLSDVIIPDVFSEGKTTYTRLERHTVVKDGVKITQKAFKSNQRDAIGSEIPLTEVERWSSLQPEATVQSTDGPLFGWYKVAAANTVDVDSPLGASVYAKAVDVIREADMQYSRILWEYEGSELAIDVDPTVLRPKKTEGGGVEMPKLNQRLFRAVDADKGDRDLYEVFSPNIRDGNLFNGLNNLFIRIEDLTGLSRGTISDENTVARTATELKINKQRSFTTISDNQAALERCLKNVIRAMDKYASAYNLAPEGEYDVSFEWDDSILTDTEQQTQERLMLMNAGIMGKVEFRKWYFGETEAQAKEALKAVTDEQVEQMQSMNGMLPTVGDENEPPVKGGDINGNTGQS